MIPRQEEGEAQEFQDMAMNSLKPSLTPTKDDQPWEKVKGRKTLRSSIKALLFKTKFKVMDMNATPNSSRKKEDSSPPVEGKKKSRAGSASGTFMPVRSLFSSRQKTERDSSPALSQVNTPDSDRSFSGTLARSQSAVFYPFNYDSEGSGKMASNFPTLNTFRSKEGNNYHGRAFRDRYKVSKSVQEHSTTTAGENIPVPALSESTLESFRKLQSITSMRKMSRSRQNSISSAIGGATLSVDAAMDPHCSAAVVSPLPPDNNEIAKLCADDADVAVKQGNYELAVAEYSKAIIAVPENAELWLCRAAALHRLGCHMEALTDATRASGLNPQSPKPHYQLGLIYKSLQDDQSAVKSIRKALELEANPPPRLVALILKAESVLGMHQSLDDRSETASAVCFQPTGRPMPATSTRIRRPVSGVQLAVPAGKAVESVPSSPKRLPRLTRNSVSGPLDFHTNASRFDESGSTSSDDSPRLFALGMDNGEVTIWETDSWHKVQTLTAHQEKIIHLLWSPDGRVLTSASVDGEVCFWKVTGKRADDGQTDPAVSDNGSRVALRFRLSSRLSAITSLKFSEDSARVASICSDNRIRIWCVESGRLLAALEHSSAVSATAFSLDGKLIITAGADGFMRVWKWTTGSPLFAFSAKYVQSLQFFRSSTGPDGVKRQYFASCHQSSSSSLRGHLCVWSMAVALNSDFVSVEEVARVATQGRVVSSDIQSTEGGGMVAAMAQIDGSLNVCSLAIERLGEKQLRVMHPQENASCLSCVSMSPCGKFFSGLNLDGKVGLWTISDCQLDRVLAEGSSKPATDS